jgi:hypothetical protein
MPRLRISLPEGLRGEEPRGAESSRPLGAGIEGADEVSQQVDRWLSCWAQSDE